MTHNPLPSLREKSAFGGARVLLGLITLVVIAVQAAGVWQNWPRLSLIGDFLPFASPVLMTLILFIIARTLLDIADTHISRLAEAREQHAILTSTARQAAVTNRSEVDRNDEGKRIWKVWRDGQEIGAHTANELIKLVRSGRIKQTDHYFDAEVGDWMPLGAHPTLVGACTA